MQSIKVVLTGGPSGGKTTLAQAIKKEFNRDVALIPEAASLLFSGGFPRFTTRQSISHRQRAIYYVQRELEDLIDHESQVPLLVCDRGSLDGIAYWPGRQAEFLKSVNSSLKKEMARYTWVLHLDTAPRDHYDVTNPLRLETYDEAWRLNEKIKAAWEEHPRRVIITNDGHFLDKLHRSLLVIEEILAGRTYKQIQTKLTQLQSGLRS